eukprot:gb/GEZN01009613.1/.p1 GENE.gb/GEZN01009613.1/~~gb/GEZN01009613.1/.p1  ORF type:complete len:217 (-),score=26.56 gb/GEZN01009613.1/:481-1131(-)
MVIDKFIPPVEIPPTVTWEEGRVQIKAAAVEASTDAVANGSALPFICSLRLRDFSQKRISAEEIDSPLACLHSTCKSHQEFFQREARKLLSGDQHASDAVSEEEVSAVLAQEEIAHVDSNKKEAPVHGEIKKVTGAKLTSMKSVSAIHLLHAQHKQCTQGATAPPCEDAKSSLGLATNTKNSPDLRSGAINQEPAQALSRRFSYLPWARIHSLWSS